MTADGGERDEGVPVTETTGRPPAPPRRVRPWPPSRVPCSAFPFSQFHHSLSVALRRVWLSFASFRELRVNVAGPCVAGSVTCLCGYVPLSCVPLSLRRDDSRSSAAWPSVSRVAQCDHQAFQCLPFFFFLPTLEFPDAVNGQGPGREWPLSVEAAELWPFGPDPSAGPSLALLSVAASRVSRTRGATCSSSRGSPRASCQGARGPVLEARGQGAILSAGPGSWPWP